MLTMQPVLRRGRSVWDQGLFPEDEFEERVRTVRAVLARERLQALVVIGGGDDYANLTYLTNLVPWARWGTVIIPLEGEPILIPAVMGGRDLPFVRSLTWIADVRSYPSLGKGVREVLAGWGIAGGPIGTAGLEAVLPVGVYRDLLGSLEGYERVPMDGELAALRRRKRPREVAAIRAAACLLRRAEMAAVDGFLAGASNVGALVEAERVARAGGAHDFRALANLGPEGELWPCEGPSEVRRSPLVAYLAVEHEGYWADHGFTLPLNRAPLAGPARRAMEAMRSVACAGATGSDVAAATLGELSEEHQSAALRCGLGSGIGLSLIESPLLAPGSEDPIEEGATLTLRVHLMDASSESVLVSDLVLVGTHGCESLL